MCRQRRRKLGGNAAHGYEIPAFAGMVCGGNGNRGGFWHCFGGNLAFPPKTIPAKAGISRCRACKQRRIRRQFSVPKQLIPA